MKTIFIRHNYILLQQLHLPLKMLLISTSKGNQSWIKKKGSQIYWIFIPMKEIIKIFYCLFIYTCLLIFVRVEACCILWKKTLI